MYGTSFFLLPVNPASTTVYEKEEEKASHTVLSTGIEFHARKLANLAYCLEGKVGNFYLCHRRRRKQQSFFVMCFFLVACEVESGLARQRV